MEFIIALYFGTLQPTALWLTLLFFNIKSFRVEFRTVKATQGHTFTGTERSTGIKGSALVVRPFAQLTLDRISKTPKSNLCASAGAQRKLTPSPY